MKIKHVAMFRPWKTYSKQKNSEDISFDPDKQVANF